MKLENSVSLTFEEQQEVADMFLSNPRKMNPDFIYLEALFNKKIGQVEKSVELFQNAMVLYEKESVQMNNTSTFLKNYMELFRVINN
jgi:hypothetical protein